MESALSRIEFGIHVLVANPIRNCPVIFMSISGSEHSQQQAMLSGERIAFTGTLASMTHRQAASLAESHGGSWSQHVSKQNTMLVIGEEGWPLEADGTPSVKLQQANRLREEGVPIRIVSESEWLGILGLSDRMEDVRRHYTPAMLSQMLGVSVIEIRRWERCGLIQPVKHVLRLPYFDYREVMGVRRLTELLTSGVSRRQISESLDHLKNWLTGTERPLAQLELLKDSGELIFRDPTGPVDPYSGQRLFDFDQPADEPGAAVALTMPAPVEPHDLPEKWYATAQKELEENRLSEAVQAFRNCLRGWHHRAEIHFQLADTLYRLGNLPGALERYHVAIELDPDYLEAWTQLGCVLADQGEWEESVTVFEKALDLHADYPDAHWHLAQALEKLGRPGLATAHWTAYLQFDERGPWADIARERLQQTQV